MKYFLALLADIANGLFATLAAGWYANVELVWWYFLLGIGLAMSPDLDAIPELLRRGRVSAAGAQARDHRDGLHYPLAFLLLGLLAAYWQPFWGTLFVVATTLHFFNDFYGTGWGIKLLWPFSRRQYKLLGRRANLMRWLLKETELWDSTTPEERRLRIIVSWTAAELPEYVRRYGLDRWIEPYYLTFNWISVIEYALFLFAVALTTYALVY